MTIGIILGLFILAIVFVVFFLATYKVVDPNEAHVLTIMGKGRRIYAPKFGEGKSKTSYFYIPFLMKRIILPLQNVKVAIGDIKLNDMEVAPFICDVIAWVTVLDPIVAAEKLDSSRGDIFDSLKEDLNEIVRAISRTTSMKQEILEIMRDRKTFADRVSAEVGEELKKFGVSLVNLEINDIRDDAEKGSQIISDYESIRKVKVNSKARQEIAERDKEAVVVEEQNREESEIAKAEAEENLRKRQIQKDKAIGVSLKEQEKEISKKEEEANAQKVEATRTLEVGGANVIKEATIEKANGEAEAIRITGEKEADVTRLKGEAIGKSIEAKGSAEAIAKDKMAEAMKKFNDSALNVEKIRAWIEVQKAQYEAYGKVAENAEIKVVNSGKGSNILGLPLNAESGADLGQFMESMGGIENLGGVINKVKESFTGKKESKETTETINAIKKSLNN